MFLQMKKRILNLMDSIAEMIQILSKLSDPYTAISDCLSALNAIETQLNKEEAIPEKTKALLMKLKKELELILNGEIYEKIDLLEQVTSLKLTLESEVTAKLKIAFMPYKASMWDSLSSIHEAAKMDPLCEVAVVPIPYYRLTEKEAFPTYEGDQFPSNVSITHFSQYDLEVEQPDIVYVHNIYDGYNTLTRVYEQYFTSNIKKYTDMLVYVPYHVSSFISPKEGSVSLAYGLPSIKNVDKVVLVGEFLKNAAIRDGVPKEKLLALGSPKIDAMVETLKGNVTYPKEWENRIKDKTVYLINTGCLYFAEQTFIRLEKLIDFFNIPRIDNNSIVIWRPHPLTETSIRRYIPFFLEYYLELTQKFAAGEDPIYNHIILDESPDYLPALHAADVLISSDGSLLRSYLVSGKKVLFWGDSLPNESLVTPDSFYFAFNKNEPWYELVKKISEGYDPLAQKRKELVSKIYANTDGTSGAKIHLAIKNAMNL